MNSKVVVVALALLGNSLLLHAQTITDNIFFKHPDVAFHKYDPAAEILFVLNTEFNPSTKEWTFVLDIYGEEDKIKSFTKEWFERYKKSFHSNTKYLNENPNMKQLITGQWIKGDIVKNGYWIQRSANPATEVCQGFVVNGFREGNWLAYESGRKITERNYIHDVKEVFGRNGERWVLESFLKNQDCIKMA